MPALKKRSTAVAALAGAVLSVVASLGAGGTANAASSTFRLCNYADYVVSAWFPSVRINAYTTTTSLSTRLVFKNECAQYPMDTNRPFVVELHDQSSGSTFFTTATRYTYTGSRTLVQAWGTRANHQIGVLPY
ncbi:hypothetical protein ACIGNX_22460 [Actinosynnema sp. NPDC053489]|uniref:hypothetical protein n=1 Tax=Actinosynnema sp. NPDC053489 TaxID=3363916 RepID=UPI0037CBE051